MAGFILLDHVFSIKIFFHQFRFADYLAHNLAIQIAKIVVAALKEQIMMFQAKTSMHLALYLVNEFDMLWI
jgi:hypothetical protein